MEGDAAADVVGLGPTDAARLLAAGGWQVRVARTCWPGATPGDLGATLTVPRVVAARRQERTIDLVVADFPPGPSGEAG